MSGLQKCLVPEMYRIKKIFKNNIYFHKYIFMMENFSCLTCDCVLSHRKGFKKYMKD